MTAEGRCHGTAVRRYGGRSVRRYAGTTLLELLVVLVILGLLVGVSGLAVGSLKPSASSARLRALQAGHTQAIESGRVVTVNMDSITIRFLPDGRAIGPAVDLLTGEAVNVTH